MHKGRQLPLKRPLLCIFFSKGNCFKCLPEGCPQMGHYADTFPLGNATTEPNFYLNTADAPSFARMYIFPNTFRLLLNIHTTRKLQ